MVNAEPPPLTFQGHAPDEIVQFYFRQHWIRLVAPLFRLLLWSIFLAIILGITVTFTGAEGEAARRTALMLITFFFLISQIEFLMRFLGYFLYVIVVTDRKIHRIKKTLFAVDDHQSIDLRMLQDIHKHQHGLIQNLLGFGSLILEAQDTILKIHFTPRIAKKHTALIQLRGAVPPLR